MTTNKQRLIRLRTVCERTSLSKSTVYALAQRGRFPAPIKVGARSSAWVESEVEDWVQNRITATRLHLEARK